MSISIVPRDYDAPDYDGCGSMTYAVLKVNSVSIPLCSDCIKELEEEVKNFSSTIFCYKCKHYIPDKYGLIYGGICSISNHSKDFMETCKNADIES